MEIYETGNSEITELLAKIDIKISNVSEKFALLRKMTDELGKDISNIVISVQFQDITRQKIEHVINPIKEFHNDLSNSLDTILKIETDLSSSGHNDLEVWINKHYTMEEERKILRDTIRNRTKIK